jgi:hypothetical protein
MCHLKSTTTELLKHFEDISVLFKMHGQSQKVGPSLEPPKSLVRGGLAWHVLCGRIGQKTISAILLLTCKSCTYVHVCCLFDPCTYDMFVVCLTHAHMTCLFVCSTHAHMTCLLFVEPMHIWHVCCLFNPCTYDMFVYCLFDPCTYDMFVVCSTHAHMTCLLFVWPMHIWHVCLTHAYMVNEIGHQKKKTKQNKKMLVTQPYIDYFDIFGAWVSPR